MNFLHKAGGRVVCFEVKHQQKINNSFFCLYYDTRHATREFVFYARHENFKCKKMKILNATRDTSVYLKIEHTDTSVTFRDTRS